MVMNPNEPKAEELQELARIKYDFLWWSGSTLQGQKAPELIKQVLDAQTDMENNIRLKAGELIKQIIELSYD